MSENKHQEAHTGPIKTPKQVFWVSLAAFIVPVFVIIGLVSYVTSGSKSGAGTTQSEEKIAQRLQKIGSVEIVLDEGDRPLKTGEEVYNAQCAACHATGVSDAPKFGDAGDWQPRLDQGYETLLKSSLEGKGAMAPQGGGAFSDLEIGRAVVYMANAAGGNLSDPADGGAQEAEAAEEAAPAAAEEAASTALAEQPAAGESDSGRDVAEAAEPAEAAAPKANETEANETEADEQASAAAAGDAPDLTVGKALYNKACMVCHAAGVAGAPKLGDKAGWAPYIATGMEAMVKVAIEGKGAMPPRGASNATDEELRAAVAYMVSESQ